MPLKFIFGQLEYSLDGSRLRIGRADHLDITISNDPLVSSQHCVIQGGRLCDAQSTNGTMINSTKIPYQTHIQLKAGDVVTVGETNLYVEEGLPYEDTVPPPASNSHIQITGGGSSSKNSSRNLGSSSSYNYTDAATTDGEDRGAFTAYSYANRAAAAASSGNDDLSTTIHSTGEWNDALATAAQKVQNGDDSSGSSDDDAEGSGEGQRRGGGHHAADDVVTYTYGTGSLRPPSNGSSSSSTGGGHRPSSSPSTMRPPHTSPSVPSTSEEEIWNLKQALTKSELKCMNLEKKLTHLQRKGNLLQQKQKLQKFETQIQNLEYQMFYGDTMKDRELESLRASLMNRPLSPSDPRDPWLILTENHQLRNDVDVLCKTMRQAGLPLPELNIKHILSPSATPQTGGSGGGLIPATGRFKPATMKKGQSAALTEAAQQQQQGNGTIVPAGAPGELRSSPSHSPSLTPSVSSTASASPKNTILLSPTALSSSALSPGFSQAMRSALVDGMVDASTLLRKEVLQVLREHHQQQALLQQPSPHPPSTEVVSPLMEGFHSHTREQLDGLKEQMKELESNLLSQVKSLAASTATSSSSLPARSSPAASPTASSASQQQFSSSLAILTQGQNDIQNALATLLESQSKRREEQQRNQTDVAEKEKKRIIELEQALQEQRSKVTELLSKEQAAKNRASTPGNSTASDALAVSKSIDTLQQRVAQLLVGGGAAFAIAIAIAIFR